MAKPSLLNSIVLESWGDFIFPKTCALCSNHGETVCTDCEKELKRAIPRCVVCSRNNILGKTCPGCLKSDSPKLTISIFSYCKSTKDLIKSFKYDDITSLKSFFAGRLANIVKIIPDYKNYTLVPIPLAPSRKRYRGYNQSELLAREATKILRLPFCNCLARVESRHPQVSSISKKERIKNIKGVFISSLKSPAKVLLLDDVITTGATMREATRVLKKNGAEKIICVSIAM